MDAALLAAGAALLGAFIAAVAGQRSASTTARALQAVAERGVHAERLNVVRNMAASAYADARASVEWLHPDRIEDSVSSPHKERFEPVFEASIQRLRHARSRLDEVAALTSGPVVEAASAVAHALGRLDEAWESGRSWARHMHTAQAKTKAGGTGDWDRSAETIYQQAYDAVQGALEELLGRHLEGLHTRATMAPPPPAGRLEDLRAAISGLSGPEDGGGQTTA